MGSISDHHLALVWDVRGHSGHKLQIVHLLLVFTFFPIPVGDFPLLLRKREAFQGQDWPYHVLADSLSFCLGLGPDLAVDQESRVAPLENLLHQLLADQLFSQKKSEDLAGEELGDEAVMELSHMMKSTLLIQPALGD